MMYTLVRSGLKGFLVKLSEEAKDEMRCFILKTVVHKVSGLCLRTLCLLYTIFCMYSPRLSMDMK